MKKNVKKLLCGLSAVSIAASLLPVYAENNETEQFRKINPDECVQAECTNYDYTDYIKNYEDINSIINTDTCLSDNINFMAEDLPFNIQIDDYNASIEDESIKAGFDRMKNKLFLFDTTRQDNISFENTAMFAENTATLEVQDFSDESEWNFKVNLIGYYNTAILYAAVYNEEGRFLNAQSEPLYPNTASNITVSKTEDADHITLFAMNMNFQLLTKPSTYDKEQTVKYYNNSKVPDYNFVTGQALKKVYSDTSDDIYSYSYTDSDVVKYKEMLINQGFTYKSKVTDGSLTAEYYTKDNKIAGILVDKDTVLIQVVLNEMKAENYDGFDLPTYTSITGRLCSNTEEKDNAYYNWYYGDLMPIDVVIGELQLYMSELDKKGYLITAKLSGEGVLWGRAFNNDKQKIWLILFNTGNVSVVLFKNGDTPAGEYYYNTKVPNYSYITGTEINKTYNDTSCTAYLYKKSSDTPVNDYKNALINKYDFSKDSLEYSESNINVMTYKANNGNNDVFVICMDEYVLIQVLKNKRVSENYPCIPIAKYTSITGRLLTESESDESGRYYYWYSAPDMPYEIAYCEMRLYAMYYLKEAGFNVMNMTIGDTSGFYCTKDDRIVFIGYHNKNNTVSVQVLK